MEVIIDILEVEKNSKYCIEFIRMNGGDIIQFYSLLETLGKDLAYLSNV